MEPIFSSSPTSRGSKRHFCAGSDDQQDRCKRVCTAQSFEANVAPITPFPLFSGYQNDDGSSAWPNRSQWDTINFPENYYHTYEAFGFFNEEANGKLDDPFPKKEISMADICIKDTEWNSCYYKDVSRVRDVAAPHELSFDPEIYPSTDFPHSCQMTLEHNQLNFTSARDGDTWIDEDEARIDWSSVSGSTPISLNERSGMKDFNYDPLVANETTVERIRSPVENWVPHITHDGEDGCEADDHNLNHVHNNKHQLEATRIDTCFGIIVTSAISGIDSGRTRQVTPVTIKIFGNMVALHFQDSGKYAGIVNQPVLCKILAEYSAKLEATLAPAQTRNDKDSIQSKKKKKFLSLNQQERSVHIVIYGSAADKSAVGDLLSGAGLYLQQPVASECGRNTEYSNPHYLVRPGSQMPLLEEASICSDSPGMTAFERLDEVSQGRLTQLFDNASDDEVQHHIEPSPRLKSSLKPHQLSALAMMLEKEYGILDRPKFPSLWESRCPSNEITKFHHKVTGIPGDSPVPVYGGILADEMGLGKTLSLLALVCTSKDIRADVDSLSLVNFQNATLVITPKSTIPGWQRQIEKHIHPKQLQVAVYHGSSRQHLATELKSKDIVLTTYETLRTEWLKKGPLYSKTWYRLVLDEAHHIRNRSSQVFKATCAVPARNRWCLTGTPIHNSLDDYGALLSFLGVPPLETKSRFDFWIATPFKDSKLGALEKLQDLIRATCLRRTKKSINDTIDLPSFTQCTQMVQLHPRDRELYDFFKHRTSSIAARLLKVDASSPDESKGMNIISLLNFLRMICNHGEDMLTDSALKAWKDRDSASINWEMMMSTKKWCEICDTELKMPSYPRSKSAGSLDEQNICLSCAASNAELETREDDATHSNIATSYSSPGFGVSNTRTTSPLTQPSAKVESLLKNLHQEQRSANQTDKSIVTKSVVFSCWTKMLDLIQPALDSHGFQYARVDGQTSLDGRRRAIKTFNENPKSTVMLASIGSAGEGVDFTVANHVHLMEPHWNPMAEAQAVNRVHRIGQTRNVTVTRYIVEGSIEKYIQWVQQDKLSLFNQSFGSHSVPQSKVDDERRKKLLAFLQGESRL